jgi:hypothetical protein
MIEIKIKDIIYNFPTNWDEITISNINYISKIDIELMKNNMFLYYKQIFLCLVNPKIEEIELDDVDIKSFMNIFPYFKFLFEEPTICETKTILINNIEYGYREFNEIKNGEWIDSCYYFDKDKPELLEELLSIFLRPIKNNKIVEYDSDKKLDKEFIRDNVSLIFAKSFIDYYKNIQINIREKYKDIFCEDEGTKTRGGKRTFSWGWLGIIYELADNFLNVEKMWDKTLVETLNYYTYKIQKNKNGI